jgi:putative transcription antitermination factor YqgF
MVYLGIDFGLRHVGLALADGPLAEPLAEKTYTHTGELFKYLKSVCRHNLIDKIVIGLPEGRLNPLVKKFGAKVEQVLGKTVIYQDETLSTVEAKTKLLSAGRGPKQRRRDHPAAAALILQEYLDMMETGRNQSCLKM